MDFGLIYCMRMIVYCIKLFVLQWIMYRHHFLAEFAEY